MFCFPLFLKEGQRDNHSNSYEFEERICLFFLHKNRQCWRMGSLFKKNRATKSILPYYNTYSGSWYGNGILFLRHFIEFEYFSSRNKRNKKNEINSIE